MSKIGNYFLTVIMIFVLVFSSFPLIAWHVQDVSRTHDKASAYSQPYHGEMLDVRKSDVLSSEEVLGMVIPALEGKFYIIVDGVTIDKTTDMNTVNLRGVSGNYKITAVRNASTSLVEGVIANIIP